MKHLIALVLTIFASAASAGAATGPIFFNPNKILASSTWSDYQRLVEQTLKDWSDYIQSNCSGAHPSAAFCGYTLAYQIYVDTKNLLNRDISQTPPLYHLPDRRFREDYMALNWFADAFANRNQHELLIKGMLLNRLARMAMVKAIEIDTASFSEMMGQASTNYEIHIVPALKAYLLEDNKFMQAYVSVRLADCPRAIADTCAAERRRALSRFYATLNEKRPVLLQVRAALESENSLPSPDIERLRQVYELQKFVASFQNMPVLDLLQLLKNPRLLERVPGFKNYIENVKRLTYRPTLLTDVNRLRMYRSIILLGEIDRVSNRLPSTNARAFSCASESSSTAYCEFLAEITSIQNYFSGVESEIPSQ